MEIYQRFYLADVQQTNQKYESEWKAKGCQGACPRVSKVGFEGFRYRIKNGHKCMKIVQAGTSDFL